jgi:hypothetical protein
MNVVAMLVLALASIHILLNDARGEETFTTEGYVIYSRLPNGIIQNGKVLPLSAIPRTPAWGIWTNWFTMTISTEGRWMMRVSPATFPGELMYGKTQVVWQTYDKTNIYSAYYSEGTTRNRQLTGSTNLTSLTHFANISPGDYPIADFDYLPNLSVQRTPSFLWLALGSGDFFAKYGTIITTKPTPVSRTQCLGNYGVRWVCESLNGSLRLPEYIQFLRDTNLDLPVEQEINRPEIAKATTLDDYNQMLKDIQTRKDDFTNGYLSATFECTQQTNINGVTIPTAFEYKAYDTKIATPDGLLGDIVGTITNIIVSQDKEIQLPPILATLNVNDARFQRRDRLGQVDSIKYNLALGATWPDQNSPELQKRLKTSDSYRYSPKLNHLKWAVGAVAIIFLTMALPLCFYLRQKTKTFKLTK